MSIQEYPLELLKSVICKQKKQKCKTFLHMIYNCSINVYKKIYFAESLITVE